MSWLPTAAVAIGGIAEGVGGIMSAKSQYQAAQYNAQVAEQQAQAKRQSAALQEYKSRKSLRQVSGTQRAMYAKSGVESLSGSPLDVMRDTLFNANLDIMIERYNSEIEARGYTSEAEQRRYLAKQDRQLAYTKSAVSLLKTGVEYGQKMNWGKGGTYGAKRDIKSIEDYVTGKKTRIGE